MILKKKKMYMSAFKLIILKYFIVEDYVNRVYISGKKLTLKNKIKNVHRYLKTSVILYT